MTNSNKLLIDDILIIVDMINENISDDEIIKLMINDFVMSSELARDALSEIKRNLENDSMWLELKSGLTLIR